MQKYLLKLMKLNFVFHRLAGEGKYKILGHVCLTFSWDRLVEQSVDNVSSNIIASEFFTLCLPVFKARIISSIPFFCLIKMHYNSSRFGKTFRMKQNTGS